jgi:hypothetical protein
MRVSRRRIIFGFAAFALWARGCETRGPILWGPGAGPGEVITLNAQSTTVEHGGPGGLPYLDYCPPNQAVLGYQGCLGTASVTVTPPPVTTDTPVVGCIQTLCGTLALDGDAGDQVATALGAALAVRGQGQGAAWAQICPADQVIVGFSGRTGSYVDQLAFRCTHFSRSLDDAGTWMTTAPTDLSPAGGDGGGPFSVESCPAGQMAIGSTIHAGALVDAFGLICGAPTLSDGG